MRPLGARELRSEEAMWLKAFRADAAIQQRFRCAYCFEPMGKFDVTADHVHPRSKGGTTKRKNIKACCGPCNLAKGSMSSKAFLNAINGESPPPGASFRILRAWMRRRLWRRTWQACQLIEQSVGL